MHDSEMWRMSSDSTQFELCKMSPDSSFDSLVTFLIEPTGREIIVDVSHLFPSYPNPSMRAASLSLASDEEKRTGKATALLSSSAEARWMES